MKSAVALLSLATLAAFTPVASAVVIAQTYNRNAAVDYADANYKKVVADGYFWINGSTPVKYGAGAAVPVNVANEASGIGDDCAHFVSTCIGSYTGTTAGGLTIPNRAGTYGEPGAARLDGLLVGDSIGQYGTTYKVATLVSSIDQLTPGDVIGYDWDGSGKGSMSGIDHTAIYVGNGLVDCHATSHYRVNYTLGGADNYFFIHITLPDSTLPNTPSITSPANNTTTVSLTPKLSAAAFSDTVYGSSQAAAQWIVKKGSTVIYDSGTTTTNLTSLTLPANLLTYSQTYTWQVRYEDNYGTWSAYSTAANLVTIPEPSALATCAAPLTLLLRRRR